MARLGLGRAAGAVGSGLSSLGEQIMRRSLQRQQQEEREQDRKELGEHRRSQSVSSRLQALGATGDAFLPVTEGFEPPEGAQLIDVMGDRFHRVPRPPPPAPEMKLPPTITTASGIFERGAEGLTALIDPGTGRTAEPFRAEPRGADPYGGRTREQWLADQAAVAGLRAGGAAGGGGVSPTTAEVTRRNRAMGAARAVSGMYRGDMRSSEVRRTDERMPRVLRQWGYSSEDELFEDMRRLGITEDDVAEGVEVGGMGDEARTEIPPGGFVLPVPGLSGATGSVTPGAPAPPRLSGAPAPPSTEASMPEFDEVEEARELVAQARQGGMDDATIRRILAEEGLTAAEVARVLGAR